jgi:hypothetical protein
MCAIDNIAICKSAKRHDPAFRTTDGGIAIDPRDHPAAKEQSSTEIGLMW